MPPSLTYFSPHLTAAQKSSLKLLEEGWFENAAEKSEAGMRSFLLASFQITLQAFLLSWDSISMLTLVGLKNDESEANTPLRVVLWREESLTPFAHEFLRWMRQGPNDVGSPPPSLQPEELIEYLEQSIDFYSALAVADIGSVTLDFEVDGESVGEGAETFPDGVPPADAVSPFLDLQNQTVESEAKVFPEVAKKPVKGQYPPPPLAPPDDVLETLEVSRVPLSPLEERSQLAVRKKYLGHGKNADGVLGYCGQLTVSRFDDREFGADLEASNPLLFFSPKKLKGTSVVVTYWMPPAAFPQPGGHLTLSAAEQRKVIPIVSLFPKSRTDYLRGRSVVLMLMAPSLFGLFYFALVYLVSAMRIENRAQSLFPEMTKAALRGVESVSFREGGVGLYQLEVLPTSESIQLIWAGLIFLCPLLATKFFRHLSRHRQRRLSGTLGAALLLPSAGLMLIWNLQRRFFPLWEHPDFASMDLRRVLPWGIGLNVVIAVYLFLSVFGVWDRRISSRALRLAYPVVLTVAYTVAVFLLIFGRSWTTF